MKWVVEEIRVEIADLDMELIEILAERRRLVEELGHWKRSLKLPLVDPVRERFLRDRYNRSARRHGVDPGLVQRLFDQIWEDSKAQQKGDRQAG